MFTIFKRRPTPPARRYCKVEMRSALTSPTGKPQLLIDGVDFSRAAAAEGWSIRPVRDGVPRGVCKMTLTIFVDEVTADSAEVMALESFRNTRTEAR